MAYKDPEAQKRNAKKWYEENKARRLAMGQSWHQANHDRHMKLQADWERKRKQQIAEYKLAMGCAQCGYRGHPAALHFDHLPGHEKSFAISQKTKLKWSTIVAEMEKCQVLCANCHVVQTALRHQEKQERKRKEKAEQQLRLHLA